MLRLAGTLIVLVIVSSPVLGQTAGRALDATLGVSGGKGGQEFFGGDAALTGEATLAWVRAGQHSRIPLAAVSIGRQFWLGYGDICYLRAIAPESKPRCALPFPAFAHVGLLGGSSYTGAFGSIRLLAGPAMYAISGGPAGIGAQGQLHVATPPASGLAFVVSARGAFVSRFNGQRFGLGSIGWG